MSLLPALIFLHGLGDDGRGWAETFQNVVPPYCKIICPNAKVMPVSLNFGMEMPAWYDLYGLDADARQDEPGIVSASKELAKWIAAENQAGIPSERIVIGGFSQGGSVSLYYGATNRDKKLGGLVALSCWLPLHEKVIQDTSSAATSCSVPILQCHGQSDPLVAYDLGSQTNSVLRKLGFCNCTLKSYPGMGHCSGDREIRDVKSFLETCLPSTAE
ncbi:unnamed protein product [Mesocestoides corti]|uniref:palmitoyl-protein hydrolase n=1 Tax=Mesocestoides corti TaxID=53468 RepID=A0A0R3U793_MESCO|nr:unnamed protein product [Mesocestoides corti]